jgi:hypothetical protein
MQEVPNLVAQHASATVSVIAVANPIERTLELAPV